MVKIWGRKSSSNAQAVLWCLAELGIEYERIDAGFIYGVVRSDAYLAMNPNATVPTIKDGENEPLWETGAILRYLCNRYAEESFWPSDDLARAHVDQWAEWSKINVAGKFTAPVFWQVVRTPVNRRNQEAIKTAVDALTRKLQIADQQLSQHSYLAGDNFTLADIQFGHCLYRYFDVNISRTELVNLERYYQLLETREHFNTHIKVDYSELVDSM